MSRAQLVCLYRGLKARFNSSMIILSDAFIAYAAKLILKSNISKNVIAYLSNTKIVFVNMFAFFKIVTLRKMFIS